MRAGAGIGNQAAPRCAAPCGATHLQRGRGGGGGGDLEWTEGGVHAVGAAQQVVPKGGAPPQVEAAWLEVGVRVRVRIRARVKGER